MQITISIDEQDIPAICTGMIYAGRRVSAVKVARVAFGWGLKEALDYTRRLVPDDAAPTPQPQGIPVRVAVAMDGLDMIEVEALDIGPYAEKMAWRALAEKGATNRIAILTAYIPPPTVPEIAATAVVGEEG